MAKKRRFQPHEDGGQPVAKKLRSDTPLPDKVFHYDFIAEVPWDTQFYWRQRYNIFSKYEDGIWMTDEAWFGVTPEAIARKIADHVSVAAPAGKSILVDAFCGAGGNTIAFALSGRWARVYAVEKDKATLECAKHNAEIYGVHDRITWLEGDCFEILGTEDEVGGETINVFKELIETYGVVFASPPWGGPGYKSEKIFRLDGMQPYSLNYMFERFSKLTKSMVLYLPRTSDLRQIAACVEEGKKAQVVHYCTNGASRALCAYLGDWTLISERSG